MNAEQINAKFLSKKGGCNNAMEVNRIYNKNGSYSKNCPNCGAAIESEKCPYCGTTFIDFACMDTKNPFWLKLKRGEEIFIAKVCLSNVTVERPNNNYYHVYSIPGINISVDFHVLNYLGKE